MDLATFSEHDHRWLLDLGLDVPADKAGLWAALTTRGGLKPWFPSEVLGEWSPGARLEFRFPGGAGQDEEVLEGKVLALEPLSLLSYDWCGDILTFRLTPAAGGTRLTLTASIDEQGRGARDAAGWHCSLTQLAASLGAEVAAEEKDWRVMNTRYQTAFGPAAGTIGPPEGHDVTEPSS